MDSNETSVVNVGKAVRSGLRLKTVEAVALVHAVCAELDLRTAAGLPTSPDNLTLTDAGTVKLFHAGGELQPTRLAVAKLLERLLGAVTDEPGAVPPALRTLPGRLRAVGAQDKKSDVKDLLSILRWHLPRDSREVLQDLFVRAKLSEAGENEKPASVFAAVPPHQTGVVPHVNAANHDDLVLQTPQQAATIAALPIVTKPTIVTRPTVVPMPAPVTTPAATAVNTPVPTPEPMAARERRSSVWKYVAAAVLAFAIAGYSGYRFTESRVAPDATQVVEDQTAPPTPRVVVPQSEQEAGVPAAGAVVVPQPEQQATAPSAAASPAPAPATELAPATRVVVPRQPMAPRPVNLAVRGGAFSPSYTAAEPRTLLFHAGSSSSGRLFTATLDDRGGASALTPLFEETARNYHARPSPDGRWIAFDSDRQGVRGVFVADRSGKQISRVSGEGFAAVPSWSPDMSTLAFIRSEPGRSQVWNLWMRDLATGQLSRASQFRSGQVWGASWFADSASYAYSHEDRLIIADRAGKQVAAFKSPIAGRLVRTPAVSPNGREIMFQVYRDGAWIVDVKTGAMRRVLDDPTAEEFTWSPDGGEIAYHSRRDGEWRIWVMTP